MPRKDDKLAVVSSKETVAVEEVPQPRQSYFSQFTALPVKVLVREAAERKIMILCPHFDAETLSKLSIDQIERTYRCRMNAYKAGAGERVFVVATGGEVADKFTEVHAMYAALRGEVAELPEQRIDLDASSELVGAAS